MSVGDSGWVKLWRSAMDSAVFCDRDPFIFKLFCWCVMKAAHKADVWQGETIERGQFITGRFSAARELQVDPNKIVRGFARLAELGCIETKANSRRTLVTVCNYTTYQSSDNANRTAGEQQVNSQRTAGEHRQEANNLRIQERVSVAVEQSDPTRPVDRSLTELTPTSAKTDERWKGGWEPTPTLKASIVDAVRKWQAWYWREWGKAYDFVRVEAQLKLLIDMGWSPDKFAKAIEFSIVKGAKNILDPDKPFQSST